MSGDGDGKSSEVTATAVTRESAPAMPRCANCRKAPGAVKWIGGTGLLWTLGRSVDSAWWCERCVFEAQLAYAEAQAARIPGLRDALTRATAAQSPPGSGVGV